MGAFEGGGFIIVGPDPDATQWRFSTSSPSGFPEHRFFLSVCAYDTLPEYVQVQIFCIWRCNCGRLLATLASWIILNYSIFDNFIPVSTVTSELQSYLYNRQYQLSVRKSGFLCKTSGEESFYRLWFSSFSDRRIKEEIVYVFSLFTAGFWF